MTAQDLQTRIDALQHDYTAHETELLRTRQRVAALEAHLERCNGGILALRGVLQADQDAMQAAHMAAQAQPQNGHEVPS